MVANPPYRVKQKPWWLSFLPGGCEPYLLQLVPAPNPVYVMVRNSVLAIRPQRLLQLQATLIACTMLTGNTQEAHTVEYAEAKRLGFKKYNTGRPCKRGHAVDRYTSTRTCTQCQYETLSKWVRNHPEKHREQGRDWQRRNAHRYTTAEYRAKFRDRWRSKRGFPTPTRPAPDNCECCDRKLEVGKFHLDHDHATGAFRGWLCNRCNLGIGQLGDSSEGLERALAYLRRT
jgi:Recombination endonuclease VII